LVAQQDPQTPAFVLTATVSDTFRPSKRKFAYLLRITYGIWLPETDEWVDVPLLTGPVHELAHNPEDGTVEISVPSKESQHLDPSFLHKPFNVKKGIRIHRAIRLLFEARGEPGRFRFPRSSKRLNNPRSWGIGAQPWLIGHRLARQIDRELYYRGNGDLVLRKEPRSPVWKFRDGRDCIVIGHPTHRLSISQLRNMVIVKGGRSKKKADGKRKRKIVKRQLRDKNPLSSQTITGGKRPRVQITERDKLTSKADLKDVAKKQLKRKGGELEQEITVSCLPIPHLELGDPVVVDVRGLRKRFRVRRFSMNATSMEINFERVA
jgi:hypothetical protein